MTAYNDFQPNWFSAPGETIAKLMMEKKLSLGDLSDGLGLSLVKTREMLRGQLEIDSNIAIRLSNVFGASSSYWQTREIQYREDVERCANQIKFDEARSWLSQLPVRDMAKFGWISGDAEKLESCITFFGVSSIDVWHEKYGSDLKVVAFRSTEAFESKPGSVVAWLREGQRKSEEIYCNVWNVERFKKTLPDIRKLTRMKRPSDFLPILQQMCADCGVAVVVVRAPNGCRASGATKFLSHDKAMILLSFRYLSDDQFWFTFFHEAGHLILHSKDSLFLEDESDVTSEEEIEADQFAANLLVPVEDYSRMAALRINYKEIIRFAWRIGISPGIVVGQLQHMGRIKPGRMNKLKRRYNWEEVLV